MFKILIVEDDRILCNLLINYIRNDRRQPYCFSANTLKDALVMIDSIKFDLILFDVALDKIALPIIPEIRLIYPTNPPRLVMYSAMSGADILAYKYKIEFLSKPFLLESIDSIIPIG